MKIIFEQSCSYTIEKGNFPASIKKNYYCVFDITDSGVQEDLKYMNTYCEGFHDLGLDPIVVNVAAPYINVTYDELSKIAMSKFGFAGIWTANALLKSNCDTIFKKADVLRYNCLISLAYEEMKKAYKLSSRNQICISELIKLCAMVSDFELGRKLIIELLVLDKTDKYLKNSIQFLKT